jgi:hypothetical protein
MGFLGQSSRFEVIVLIKLVTMLYHHHACIANSLSLNYRTLNLVSYNGAWFDSN